MEMTKVLSVDVTDRYGEKFRGDFVFKTVLTRRESAFADQVRRQILGPSPDGTQPLPATHNDAFMLGQLSARVVDSPIWWKNSDLGRDILDPNVIAAVYDKALEAEESVTKSVQKDAVEATKTLKAKKPKETQNHDVVGDDE